MIDSQAGGFHAPDVPPASVYDRCVRCGLCLPTCPTYVETLLETSSPRGRIALIKAVDEGRIAPESPGFLHQMSECLDCRACEAACPSGVAYGRLIEPARAQIERTAAAARSPVDRFLRARLLGTLFTHLGTMRFAAGLVRFYQRSGLRAFARSSGLLRRLGLESVEALAPEMSQRFFVPADRRWPSDGPARAVAFLHAGCIMQVAFAEWNEATVRVLRRCGCEVIAPAAQGCCGAIAIHAGDLERGRALARANIAAFERSGADAYVVNAAGCGSALKEYGELLAADPAWSDRAAAFSAQVRDVTEYLDELGLAPGLGVLDQVATFAEPCHLAHAQRITAAPRRLLAQIPGLRLREMNESSLCCGGAGIYGLTQPEMAERLRKRKVVNTLAVSPQVVVTANPGCALALTNGLREAGAEIAVRHVVQMLDESYAAYRPTSRASSESAATTVG